MRTTKRCARCGQVVPLTEFHKRAASRDGVGGYCRPCGIRYSEQRRRSQGATPRPVRNPLKPGETKECRRCHRMLDATEFYPSQQNSDGRRSFCKSCNGEARKEWVAAHPERRNEIQRQYWARKTAKGKLGQDQ